MADNSHSAENTHSEVGAAENGGGEAGLPQLDTSTWVPQLVWLAITFVVLYLFFAKAILPKLGQVIEERRGRIADDLDKAAELKEQTDAALAAYEASLAQARGKAHAIAQEMRDKMNEEMEAQKKVLDDQLADKIEAAEKRITEIKADAMANVESVATDVTAAVLSKLGTGTGDGGQVAQAVQDALKSRGLSGSA